MDNEITIETLIGILTEAISGGMPKESQVFVCDSATPTECEIEKSKPIFSACSCEKNKRLVLFLKPN